jgi:hypothetical protein
MPQPVAELEEPDPVLGRHDPAVAVEVGEIGDAGAEPLRAGLADMTRGDVVLELAEMPGEGDLLLIADVLVSEDENRVFGHPGIDRGDFGGGERRAAVDAVDLGDEQRMQRADNDGMAALHPGRDALIVACALPCTAADLPAAGHAARLGKNSPVRGSRRVPTSPGLPHREVRL